MPNNLLTQLDRYGDHVDRVMNEIAQPSPFGVEPGVSQLSTGRMSSWFHRRPGWVVTALAATSVLVTVGGVALLLSSGGGPDRSLATNAPVISEAVPESTDAPPTSVASSEAPSPPPTAPAPSSAPNPAPPAASGAPSPPPELITVADLVWQRVPDPDVFVDAELRGATFGPGEWVVVGSIWPDPAGDGLPRAAVWHSVDGVGWDLVSDDPVVFPDFTRVLDVHWAPPAGYVAVGFERGPLFGFSDGIAAAWTSLDGITWSRVTDLSLSPDGGYESALMEHVIWAADGYVAAGRLESRDGHPTGPSTDAAAWFSPDGINWTRTPIGTFHDDISSIEGLERSSVLADSFDVPVDGYLAVGWIDPGDVADPGDYPIRAWVSEDGLQWRVLPDDEHVFDGAGKIEAADFGWLQTPTQVYMVGGRVPGEGFSDAAFWEYRSDTGWQQIVVEPGAVFAKAVAVGDEALIVVGGEMGGGGHGLTWIGSVEPITPVAGSR